MKTYLKLSAFILMFTFAVTSKSQSIQICWPNSAVLTASNTANLSNPTYSMNPGGITSANGVFTVSPLVSTNYTLYVTGLNQSNVLTTTTTNSNVGVGGGASFNVSSTTNFSLGCGFPASSVLNINNAMTFPVAGGPVSYTFIPPGSNYQLPFTGSLSANSSATINTPGTWTIGVMNLASGCVTWSQVAISGNTLAPGNWTVTTPQLLDCNTPSMVLQASTGPGYTYTWFPSMAQNSSLTVSTNTSAASSSVAVLLTLQIQDINNSCIASTVIPVYQNIFRPNPGIAGPGGACQPSVVLTNTSTSGIPPVFFPSPQPVVATLWQGPPPQQPQTFTSTYVAQTSGVYTLTVKDLNNGCERSDTVSVNLTPGAAFVHTISGGQATFNDISTGTSTNAIYFWDFGDGNCSTLQNPVHTYTSGGAYVVKLKVTDGTYLCKDSTMQSVTITGVPCIANSNFSTSPTSTPQVWNVIPASPWNISSARWDWGDGSSSSTLYTSHQYSAAGMYNICLSVTVSCASTASTCTSYSVYRATQAAQIIEVHVIPPALVSGIAASKEQSVLNWEIIPNPNSGDFVLVTGISTAEVFMSIHDLSGRQLLNRRLNAGEESISVSVPSLPAGVYIISVDDGQTRSVKRMVVMH